MRSWGSRRLALTLLWLYLGGLAFVLLNPSAELPSRLVGWAAEGGQELRLPATLLLPHRVEFVANTMAVVPVTALAAWLWPARSWTTWTAYGYVGALGVEAVQALLLPARSATFVDVVSNTLGALVGALGVQLVRRASSGEARWTTGPRDRL